MAEEKVCYVGNCPSRVGGEAIVHGVYVVDNDVSKLFAARIKNSEKSFAVPSCVRHQFFALHSLLVFVLGANDVVVELATLFPGGMATIHFVEVICHALNLQDEFDREHDRGSFVADPVSEGTGSLPDEENANERESEE